MSEFENWDQYFMTMAYLAAMKSKDPSTHVGAVIVGTDNQVIATGYNSLPRGFDDSRTDVMERPLKYKYFEHSERNAIFNAALTGVKTKGTRMYTLAHPCSDCARAIVQSGITEVIVRDSPNLQNLERWSEDMNVVTLDIFRECGINFRKWDGEIPELKAIVDSVSSKP